MKKMLWSMVLALMVSTTVNAELITGVVVTEAPGNGWPDVSPQVIVDGSGLYGDPQWHYTGYGITWISNTNGADMVFDLGQDYLVSDLRIWNNNLSGATWQGTRSFTLEGKASIASSYTAVQGISLNQAPGTDPWSGGAEYYGEGFDVPDFTARYIKFSNIQALNPPSAFGFSEIQFFGTPVPEPMSMMLLSLGTLGLLRKKN
jgi:hypothetical protein